MISLVLPNYCPDGEVEALLVKFLDTLETNTDLSNCELIVVENGSETAILKEKADVYLHFDKPIGYARAVNYGLKIARGDHIVILNNDLEVPPHWLENMLAVYVGGTLAPVDYDERQEIIENSHWFSLVLFDRALLDLVGMLDEEKLNYRFHDQDFSIRVKRAGYPVRRTGRVKVKHINSATYKKMNRDEDPAERAEMIRRWGAPLFSDYARSHPDHNV